MSDKKQMEVPGIEPGASYMQSMRSTTELHPRSIDIAEHCKLDSCVHAQTVKVLFRNTTTCYTYL